MTKKIPNFLSNQRLVVSNFLDRNEGLIIGDTKKVLDIKNQYLIETFKFTIFNVVKKIKGLTYASIEAEDDGYTDFHFYPLIDIKKKGSGLSDIYKKNQHLPSGFICIHDYTPLFRRSFEISTRFKEYTKKKFFVKSIKIENKSICFFPLSNNLTHQPFETVFDRNLDLDIISLGKKSSEVVKIINKSKKYFKFETSALRNIKSKIASRVNLIKSFKEKGYLYRNFIEFSEELEKKGAKIEIIDRSAKPFEQYDLDSKELKNFKKELISLEKQKNKKKGRGDIIKSEVDNGIYNVYNPVIRVADDEYEGKKYPQYNSFIFVVKK